MADGGGIFFPIRPQTGRVRFLHAAYGYPPFRILVNQSRAASWLNYASLSSYSRVPAGYQTVTVTGTDGYFLSSEMLTGERKGGCPNRGSRLSFTPLVFRKKGSSAYEQRTQEVALTRLAAVQSASQGSRPIP